MGRGTEAETRRTRCEREAYRREATAAEPVAAEPVAAEPVAAEPVAAPSAAAGGGRSPAVEEAAIRTAAAPSAAAALQPPAKAISIAANTPSASVTTAGRRSEIFLPLVGSLDGLRVTLWREPPALVVDLPSARVASPAALRSLRGGGIRRVRLDESRSTPQIQLFLNTALARFVTKNVPHGLLIVLEYDLRAMP
jgi:hypothetical protein